MNTIPRSPWIIPRIFLTVVVTLFFGCAHQEHPEPIQQADEAVTPVPVLDLSAPRLIKEKGNTYRIVDTPFGAAKTQVANMEQPEEQQGDAAKPLPNASPPEPEPPATERRVNRILFRANPTSEKTKTGEVTLNFDEADLYEVIRTLAGLLDINYMVDPAVRGQVTIHTTGTLNKEDLFPIFFQILEANGLTAVKDGPLYKIAPIKDANRMAISARIGRSEVPLHPSERIVLQIIPLKNIDPEQMIKILTPFISVEGTIISHKASNTIMLVDKGANILKALKLVEAFDIDLFSGVSHRFYKIEYNSVEDITKPLTEVLTAYTGDSNKGEVKVIPIKHLNMILVLSVDPRLFDRVSQVIETLDTPNETVQSSLYVYSVKNGEAEELAQLLSQIFNKRSGEKSGTNVSKPQEKAAGTQELAPTGNPFAQKPTEKATEARSSTVVTGDVMASGTLRGELKVTADSIRNALIIEAIPSDYRIVKHILERLDVMPRQVLIEAMIAEITLDDSTQFGVEWRYVQGDGGSLALDLLAASMGAAGMQYVIGQTDRWSATLSALASENKVNILSAPTVLASNDKPATINISTEVPVASAQYQFNDASTQPVVTTNIEYRNTGIILDVTPHINANGMVSMEISQEVSEQSGEVIVGGQPYPSFFQRTVKTTLTAGHKQTIVIGGLIRENKATGQAGVPGISKIPILGALFGTTSQSASKAELIILITPRVIVNLNDVDEVTTEFKAMVPNVW